MFAEIGIISRLIAADVTLELGERVLRLDVLVDVLFLASRVCALRTSVGSFAVRPCVIFQQNCK